MPAVSPYAERVYELLCHPAHGGGGLYDIAAVQVEFVSALVELLVEVWIRSLLIVYCLLFSISSLFIVSCVLFSQSSLLSV